MKSIRARAPPAGKGRLALGRLLHLKEERPDRVTRALLFQGFAPSSAYCRRVSVGGGNDRCRGS
jgi:hypothetical protein